VAFGFILPIFCRIFDKVIDTIAAEIGCDIAANVASRVTTPSSGEARANQENGINRRFAG
jgi:hypothetical protein